jgi:hypothetical protein
MTPIMLAICVRDLTDESLISSLESHKFALMSRRGVHGVGVVETISSKIVQSYHYVGAQRKRTSSRKKLLLRVH